MTRQPEEQARLLPIPAPKRVLHERASLHDLDAAFMRALDADDWRDERQAAPINPQQLSLFEPC